LKILVTGAAGFIGFHVSQRLLERGETVLGLDNLNDYYDPKLKRDRLAQLQDRPGFHFIPLDVADQAGMKNLFADARPERVIHLAAQAGVRYSLENPHAYTESNLVGFTNILEGCRHTKVNHLVYASSSSVYGDNRKIPFSEHDSVDHPVSLYAASKKANELMAHCYSHLYRLPTTGLRFFTVYGPWGRPDMALFLFTKAILEGQPIQVFNEGKMSRDFTYVDDIVEGILRVSDSIPVPNPDWGKESADPATSTAPYRVFNIGNGKPVKLMQFIEAIEAKLGRQAIKELLPLQPGDVPATFADVTSLEEAVGFRPQTSVQEGIGRFIDWYRSYYQQ
jgi:UDP-glucuronate 4-epimerase